LSSGIRRGAPPDLAGRFLPDEADALDRQLAQWLLFALAGVAGAKSPQSANLTYRA
jgi:hypothetical protein